MSNASPTYFNFSTALMDFAGNPYGTYDQEEPCIYCGQRLTAPAPRNLVQLIATKLAVWSRKTTEVFKSPRGNWMHAVLKKSDEEVFEKRVTTRTDLYQVSSRKLGERINAFGGS